MVCPKGTEHARGTDDSAPPPLVNLTSCGGHLALFRYPAAGPGPVGAAVVGWSTGPLFLPAPHASSSGVAWMFLLQCLQTRGSRGSKGYAAKALKELETGPESNPVRVFSPGSSCTPLWSPAKRRSAAAVLSSGWRETSGR